MSESVQTHEDALRQYERWILTGQKITLKGTDKAKERLAIAIIRYAITDLLGWTGEEARDHLTPWIMDLLKLSNLCSYISFPPDIDQKQDLGYLVSLCFPSVPFDMAGQVLSIYEKVLRGDLKAFRKNFFKGDNGYKKMDILLRAFIANNLSSSSVEELYAQFADTSGITKKLSKAKLLTTVKRLYCTPLDALHSVLPYEERDEFLYNYYSYMNAYRLYVADIGGKYNPNSKSMHGLKPRKQKAGKTKNEKK